MFFLKSVHSSILLFVLTPAMQSNALCNCLSVFAPDCSDISFGRVETMQCHNCVSYLVKYYLHTIIVFLYLSQNEDECTHCHQNICSIPIVALLLICFSIEARILSKIAYFLFAVYLSENCAFQYLALVSFFSLSSFKSES